MVIHVRVSVRQHAPLMRYAANPNIHLHLLSDALSTWMYNFSFILPIFLRSRTRARLKHSMLSIALPESCGEAVRVVWSF